MTATHGVDIVSLGCRLNIAESERIRAFLGSDDNIVVINSCAVTTEAVRQTRQAIRKARRARPDARLLVTGCAAEIERDQLAAMPEVDGLVANAAKLDPRAWNSSKPEIPPPGRHTRAFVAVQNGCDHSCTFCIIPEGRGASRSLTVDEVLREIEGHLGRRAPEVVLTGVDLTSWGQDLPNKPPLGALISRILDRFPDLDRLRLSSLDGAEVDEAMFELLTEQDRIMPHLHLSLQHGHDLMLKRMRRRHSRADAVRLVERLKSRRPEITIGADLIAGFPTEDQEHHEANLSIVRDLDIVHGHIFPYSPRPGTPAARMPQLDRSLVKQRAAEMRTTVSQARTTWLQTLIGRPMRVLAEGDGTGYAENYARVGLRAGTPIGAIVTITPTRIEEGMLR